MSAFFVTAETVADAAACIREAGLATLADLRDLDAAATGRALWAMNAEALRQRYGHHDDFAADAESYAAQVADYAAPEASESAVQRIKSLACFLYQCSEGDVPETELFRVCDSAFDVLALRMTGEPTAQFAGEVIRNRSDYDAAEWDRSPAPAKPPATVRSLAADLAAAFVSDTRADGSTFCKLRDGSPDWMDSVTLAAHDNGGIFPDDFRYDTIRQVAEAISERADADADDLRDLSGEIADSMVSIYNADLCRWLGSHGHRPGYCDEAAEEMGGTPTGIIQLIQWGQYREIEEVFASVLDRLADLAEDDVAGEGEE